MSRYREVTGKDKLELIRQEINRILDKNNVGIEADQWTSIFLCHKTPDGFNIADGSINIVDGFT